MIKDYESIDVFIGVDVGKSDHHAVALDRAGKKLWDKVMIKALSKHGRLLFVVDQRSDHRCPAGRRRPEIRNRGRLPTKAGHA